MAICHRSEIRVYDRTGSGSYTVLPATGVKWSWQLGGGGFLSLQAESRAEPLASAPTLLDDCVIKVALPLAEPGAALTEVAAFANRGRAGTLWDGAGQQTREIRGAGSLFTVWSQDAVLHPEGNAITQLTAAERYFGWMSSIYNPAGDGWGTPTTIGQQDSHGYTDRTGQPADWPADLGNAYWITAPAGGGGSRHLFIADLTLSAPTGVTVFFSSDESASVYVAGSLAIQTSSVEGGYQDMTTWEGMLPAGTYRIGIDKTSVDHTGFDLGLGGDSGPADPVLLAVAVGDGSGGWTPLLMTNTTQWDCYSLDPIDGEPPSLTPGAIVVELAAQAAARNVATWASLPLGFTADLDSASKAWPVREERAWRIAYDRHLDMIEGLGDLGLCPEIGPDLTLKAWGNRGTDRSATVTLATLDEVDRVSEAGTGVAATYLPVETQDGWVIVENPTAAATYGRRESALSLGNAPSIAQGKRLGQKVLDDRLAKPETERSVEFYARAGAVPFVDFWVGDTVSLTVGASTTKGVVLDLAAEQDHTEGIVRWTAKVTGDAITGETRSARFATQPGNALAVGGVGSLVDVPPATMVTLTGSAIAAGGSTSFTDGSGAMFTEEGAATASGAVGTMGPSTLPTGGTITESGGYRIHTFDTAGTYTFESFASLTVDLLVVAAGGSGGASPVGAGGGAGGLRHLTGQSLAAGSYSVVVGAGGVGVTATIGADGGASSALGTSCTGGGGGARKDTSYNGRAGGSGGGGYWTGTGGTGVSGEGYAGKGGLAQFVTGGGGGAGAAATGIDGGTGYQTDISGTSLWYAGGGGATNGGTNTAGTGGSGVGGAGTVNDTSSDGGAGIRGSGGGGTYNGGPGGNGGDGVVVIRYAI